MEFKQIAPALLASVFLGAGAHGAYAGEALEDQPLPANQFVIDLGAGVSYQPRYPGADSYLVAPFPIIHFGRFFIPGLGQVVDGTVVKRGFDFYPSFDFNGERKASDSVDLTGTNSVDWALELGIGAGYRYDWLRGFVEVRQGINGHTGQVAEFGIDVILNPSDRLELVVGPRASWGSSDYMETYFGVSAAEAAAPGSVLSAFDADAGFKTVGLAARASYALTDTTRFHLKGGWDRFIGDGRDSPIVRLGSENQLSVGAGFSYRFAFDVFE